MPLPLRARRRALLALGVAAFLVALYAAAGYLLAPSLIRNALLERASQAGLELRFAGLRSHPFALSLDGSDAQLATKNGTPIVQARRVTVDLGWSTLWRREWRLDRVVVEGPVVHALPGRSAGKSAGPMPSIFVRELRVSGGELALPDLPRLEGLQMQAKDFSTRRASAFSASAKITDAGAVRSEGTVSLAPFLLQGKLEVADAALREAWRYLPKAAGQAPRGTLSGTLRYRYAQGRLVLSQANAQARLDSGGSLAASGELALSPFDAELRLQARELPAALLKPFLANGNFVVAGGALSGKGNLRLGAKPAFDGALSIDRARIDDRAGGRLLAWERLATDELQVRFSPFGVQAGEVRLVAPQANVAIGPEGELNLAQLFAAPALDEGKAAERPRIEVARLVIEKGRLDFADRSLETPFATTVHDLQGAVAGLSTLSEEPARLELGGRVGEYGDARVRGAIDLHAPASRTTLQLRFRNLALRDFTPYAAKFAGYRIRSGRLTAELRYRVRDGRLVGENQLVFDRLELGDKVESASALDLPVNLAVALLSDAQGRIDLAIPVRGDLRDPQFDLAGLIAKAVRNTLARIVSAPFRLIASLLGARGEGEALDALTFDAGSAALSPPQEETVARLAQALKERPRLGVAIEGGYDAQADRLALQRAEVLRQLAGRAGSSAAAGAGAPGGVDARDANVVHAAERLFLERGGRSADLAPLKPRTPGYGRRLLDALAQATPLADEALAGLARRRAQAVREALVKAGIDAARIASAEPRKAQGGSLKVSLIPAAR